MPQAQSAVVANYDFGAGVGPLLGTAATALVTLSTVVDTNTITLSDGTLTKVFEFESTGGVTSPNISVVIGGSDNAAATALAAAINTSGLRMSAVPSTNTVTITAITAEGSEASGNAYTTAKSGAPVTVTAFSGGVSADMTTRVLVFRVKNDQGGKLDLKFENPVGNSDIVVSVQVANAPTNTTPSIGTGYAATTAANNLAAVTNVTVPRRCSREATIALRKGQDNYVRVLARGAARGNLQIRGDDILEPVRI